ncbi:MAG: hypothetical protein A2487_08610 [Candidatus Raymondbacteria bacterium RifOxyC12_full_50_8]|nr:MAG: hypothetical protein A2487_08610 [Candidatus Raymondbacteria bacterium RifOxyC12_full_50_8]
MSSTRQTISLILTALLMSLTTVGNADGYVVIDTIYTPKGTPVLLHYSGPEYNDSTMAALNALFQELYPNATLLSDASMLYICHSFAWNMSEGGPIGNNSDAAYITDGSYVEKGYSGWTEKVSYGNDHSAIQTTEWGIVDSKWNTDPLFRHAIDYCPYDPVNLSFYVHYGRTVRNMTFNIGYQYDRRVASNGDMPMDSSIVDSGAKVDFLAGGTITISPPFHIENGATVSIRIRDEGLGKPIAFNNKSDGLLDSLSAENSYPSEYAISNYPNPFNPATTLKYQLPVIPKSNNTYNVSIIVFNIRGVVIKRCERPNQPAGTYTESWDGKDGRGNYVPGGIYFYRVRTNYFTKTIQIVFLP